MIKTASLAIIWLILAGLGGAVSVLSATHLYLSPSLPSVESLRDIRFKTPLRIYSGDGKLIGEIGDERRSPVKFGDIPQRYIDAILSAEDDRFFNHGGVSIKGLLRAATQLMTSGDIQGGGSTITMQVARNFFLSKRQEFKRKFNEILLALRIERELSKQEILELYVNVIFLGSRAYGIQAAAQVYYGTSLDHLSTAQLAMIAGAAQRPSDRNPIANPTAAVQRRNWILHRMLQLGKIDESEYALAIKEPDVAEYHSSQLEAKAPYMVEMARAQALEMYGPNAYTDGYQIYTTLDSRIQDLAQNAVLVGVRQYDKRHGYRGAEHHFEVPKNLPNGIINPQSQGMQPWYQDLLKDLSKIVTVADMVPAVVVAISASQVTVLSKDGKLIQLAWDEDFSAWRPHINVNSLGAKPNKPSELVALGDQIRIRKLDNNQWQFTQLPNVQSTLVSLDPNSGAALAVVGGIDFQLSSFNRATQAKRQPGSSFKPFLYSTALENGFTAASIINDAPIVFEANGQQKEWRPGNDNGKFYGPMPLRRALYLSRNLVSIRILQALGMDKALAYAEKFGFNIKEFPRDLSIALGSAPVSPMQMAGAYSVIANGGYKVTPYFIDRVLDAQGNIIFKENSAMVCNACDESSSDPRLLATEEDLALLGESVPPKKDTTTPNRPSAKSVIAPQTAYIMDSMLKDVILRGTGAKAKSLNRSDLAGKTGTTNDATDVWFAGYGGGIVAVSWLGFDELKSLGKHEFGGTGALPIWMEFMKQALADKPEHNMSRPEGLVSLRVNMDTGMMTSTDDASATYELFSTQQLKSRQPVTEGESSWKIGDNLSTNDIF